MVSNRHILKLLRSGPSAWYTLCPAQKHVSHLLCHILFCACVHPYTLCAHAHTHVNTCTHTHTHACTHVKSDTYTHNHLHAHARTHVKSDTYTHNHLHAHAHARTHVKSDTYTLNHLHAHARTHACVIRHVPPGTVTSLQPRTLLDVGACVRITSLQ